jgi:hypothetical protein
MAPEDGLAEVDLVLSQWTDAGRRKWIRLAASS